MLNWLAFFSFVFLNCYTPGPNNIMSMTSAAKNGFKKTLPFSAGVFLGQYILIGIAAVFSTGLYSYIPNIEPYLKIMGCAYMFHLAWKVFRSTGKTGGGADVQVSVLSGLALQFVNVKMILFIFTLVSTFMVPNFHDVLSLAALGAIVASISFSSTVCWALFGSMFQTALERHAKIINSIMSLLLVYCGISLFL